jgi:hypothetical protein
VQSTLQAEGTAAGRFADGYSSSSPQHLDQGTLWSPDNLAARMEGARGERGLQQAQDGTEEALEG